MQNSLEKKLEREEIDSIKDLLRVLPSRQDLLLMRN
jgi:hypothetical protein